MKNKTITETVNDIFNLIENRSIVIENIDGIFSMEDNLKKEYSYREFSSKEVKKRAKHKRIEKVNSFSQGTLDEQDKLMLNEDVFKELDIITALIIALSYKAKVSRYSVLGCLTGIIESNY